MLKISFNFDEKSQQISGLKVENYHPQIKEINAPSEECDLQVDTNKLKLSRTAMEKLNARADDRISVEYWSEGIGKSVPVIGKAEVFTDRTGGNRLSKAGTVAFRGEKRATLIQFGEFFNLEEFKEGMWKLIPIATPTSESESDLTEEEKDADDLNNKEIEAEIENILADDLPF